MAKPYENVIKDLGSLGLTQVRHGVNQYRLQGMILETSTIGKEFVTLKLHFETQEGKRCRGVPLISAFPGVLAKYLEVLWLAKFTSMTISMKDFKDILDYCNPVSVDLGDVGNEDCEEESLLQNIMTSLKERHGRYLISEDYEGKITALKFMNPDPPAAESVSSLSASEAVSPVQESLETSPPMQKQCRNEKRCPQQQRQIESVGCTGDQSDASDSPPPRVNKRKRQAHWAGIDDGSDGDITVDKEPTEVARAVTASGSLDSMDFTDVEVRGDGSEGSDTDNDDARPFAGAANDSDQELTSGEERTYL
jgi:hypothetical protein